MSCITLAAAPSEVPITIIHKLYHDISVSTLIRNALSREMVDEKALIHFGALHLALTYFGFAFFSPSFFGRISGRASSISP
jgi:hypothetical protein